MSCWIGGNRYTFSVGFIVVTIPVIHLVKRKEVGTVTGAAQMLVDITDMP